MRAAPGAGSRTPRRMRGQLYQNRQSGSAPAGRAGRYIFGAMSR